mmetsp:Transcript_6231/g.19259  ORF Transcript_6231/g.19259 Transcript_6231/m.19259 type:complete len:231 (+) Transcript_6231:328-1020(+)
MEGLKLWVGIHGVCRDAIHGARCDATDGLEEHKVGVGDIRPRQEVPAGLRQQFDNGRELGLEGALDDLFARSCLLIRAHLCARGVVQRVLRVHDQPHRLVDLGSFPRVRRVDACELCDVALHRARLSKHLAVHLHHWDLPVRHLVHLGLPLVSPLIKPKVLLRELQAAIVEQHARDLAPSRQGEIKQLDRGRHDGVSVRRRPGGSDSKHEGRAEATATAAMGNAAAGRAG